MCGVNRVYPQSIFRSRKLRLAELIVGLQGFYFIPGPPNPTVASANRHFGDHFRVHLVRTNKQTNNKNTRSISVTHERKWRFAQKYQAVFWHWLKSQHGESRTLRRQSGRTFVGEWISEHVWNWALFRFVNLPSFRLNLYFAKWTLILYQNNPHFPKMNLHFAKWTFKWRELMDKNGLIPSGCVREC